MIKAPERVLLLYTQEGNDMAKNDYFAIAYKILAYLYECFQSGEEPDTAFYNADALDINAGYWLNVIESLYDEGYIKGVSFVSGTKRNIGIKIINIKITQSGIIFLQENTMMAKAKEALKTAKEIIPCI